MELAKRIRKDTNRAEIIFISSQFEFVGEGYEVDALHYLIKPISENKLMQVLSKAADKLSVELPSFVISCNGETVKLSMSRKFCMWNLICIIFSSEQRTKSIKSKKASQPLRRS